MVQGELKDTEGFPIKFTESIRADKAEQQLSVPISPDENGGSHLTEKSARENTGRWTREEHNLFLRGLELHGKGWKKIAALIKSRTVVQIRTHAQKYFLKMHKARQDVDASGNFFDGKSHGSFRKSKKRRYDDIQISLAPSIQLFVRKCSFPSLDGDVTTQADDGLYNFLSPHLESCVTANDSNNDCVPIAKIPRWFQSGESLSSLLREAEGLNWFADSGRVVSDVTASTNTMCQEAIDGLKPPSIAIPIPYIEPAIASETNSNVFVKKEEYIPAKEEECCDQSHASTSSEACSTSGSVSSASPQMSPEGPRGVPIHSHILCSSSPRFSLLHSMHDFEDMNRSFLSSDWMLPSAQYHHMGHISSCLEDDLMVTIEGLYPEALSIY